MIDSLREALRSWLGIEDQRLLLLNIHSTQEYIDGEVEQHGRQIANLATKVSDLVKNKASARQLGRNDEKILEVLEKVRSTQVEVTKQTAALKLENAMVEGWRKKIQGSVGLNNK